MDVHFAGIVIVWIREHPLNMPEGMLVTAEPNVTAANVFP
jgi:hypothetical protein